MTLPLNNSLRVYKHREKYGRGSRFDEPAAGRFPQETGKARKGPLSTQPGYVLARSGPAVDVPEAPA
jgi:hypothetical protein